MRQFVLNLMFASCFGSSNPNRESCTSNRTGDFTFKACGSVAHPSTFCAEEKASEVCQWCKCQACPFCQPATPPPSPSLCIPWCSNNTEPWTAKCTSYRSCSGCKQCDGQNSQSLPLPAPASAPSTSPPALQPLPLTHDVSPPLALPIHSEAHACNWGGRLNANELQPPRHCTHFNSSELCHKFHTSFALCEWVSAPSGSVCTTSTTCTRRKREIAGGKHASPPPPASTCMSWCTPNQESWKYKCASFPSCKGCPECSSHVTAPAASGSGAEAGRGKGGESLIDRLNRQFRQGAPSSQLAEAGVLVHVLDKTEDPKRSWMPCRSGWCAVYGDRMSASIINVGQPGIWKGGVGFVLSPQHVHVRCAYGEDGGSMKQPGGCNPTTCTTELPYRCSWPAHLLKEALEYHRGTKGGIGYNEVVVDAHEASWKVPEVIEAIFETQAGHGKDLHESFLSTYGMTAHQVPLLRLDTATHPTAPFSAV